MYVGPMYVYLYVCMYVWLYVCTYYILCRYYYTCYIGMISLRALRATAVVTLCAHFMWPLCEWPWSHSIMPLARPSWPFLIMKLAGIKTCCYIGANMNLNPDTTMPDNESPPNESLISVYLRTHTIVFMRYPVIVHNTRYKCRLEK